MPPQSSAIVIVFAAILGACLGSFANMAAVRWHEESSWSGRSRCPNCKKTLKPKHLVPIFSWLFLRGRCASCHAPIHLQYPLVELAGAAFAVIAASRWDVLTGGALSFAWETALSLSLLVMVVMDARWKELPVELMAGIATIGAALQFVLSHQPVLVTAERLLISIAVPVVFFGVQWLVSRGQWIGIGDIWFGAMIGAVLGRWELSAIALYLSYLLGALVVVILFLARIVKRGTRVPFAPALATGLLVALWFGPMIESYVRTAFAM